VPLVVSFPSDLKTVGTVFLENVREEPFDNSQSQVSENSSSKEVDVSLSGEHRAKIMFFF
jgi:hypothetical protein